MATPREYDATAAVIEHGQLYSSGAMLVRNGRPGIEKVYPVAEWIAAERRLGGRIYRRRVVVIEDWIEVTDD